MMYASPASYLPQEQQFALAEPAPGRLRRKVKRKRERIASGQADDSSDSSDWESSASSPVEGRSRSSSIEHETGQHQQQQHSENSNSSHGSGGGGVGESRRRRKILVTEEKMAEALRELHLDLKMFDAANLQSLLLRKDPEIEMAEDGSAPRRSADISFVDIDDEEDDEDEFEEDGDDDAEEEVGNMVLTDELKETLKLLDEQRAKEIRRFLATVQISKRAENLCSSADKMQLVPYKSSPVIAVLAESSSSSSPCGSGCSMEAEAATSMDAGSPIKHFKSNSKSVLSTQNPNTLETANDSSSSASSSSSSLFSSYSGMQDTAPVCPYRVEEPSERCLEKQSLKRSYSQLNKISIEELGCSRFPARQQSSAASAAPATNEAERAAYLVDEEPAEPYHRPNLMSRVNDASTYRHGDSNNNIRFKISEITEDTEQMEL